MASEGPPSDSDEGKTGPSPIGPDIESVLDHCLEASRNDPARAHPAFLPIHQPQEVPLTDPGSRCLFLPSVEKPFVATPAALELYGLETVLACLTRLQVKARLHGGLDYLQVFSEPGKPEPLWFIEYDEGGTITALLPSDY